MITFSEIAENTFNPICTSGVFPLVGFHRLSIAHCIYLGVTGYNFKLKIVFIFSEDPFCLRKRLFLSCVCYVFVRVCLYVLCGHLLGKG